jgi:hypothetical protein
MTNGAQLFKYFKKRRSTSEGINLTTLPTDRPAGCGERRFRFSALCAAAGQQGQRMKDNAPNVCKSVCARIHSDLVRCGGGERGVTACIILVINFAHSEEIKTRQHNFQE